jgi:hypothetical protein
MRKIYTFSGYLCILTYAKPRKLARAGVKRQTGGLRSC